MHGDATAAALLAAAERIVDADGLEALSLRKLAEATSTTTRAVYSLFGNKEGVIVALARRAFELLGAEVQALPTTADSASDLVEAGMIFRRFALDHPSLFRLAVQQRSCPPALAAQSRPAAADAMRELTARSPGSKPLARSARAASTPPPASSTPSAKASQPSSFETPSAPTPSKSGATPSTRSSTASGSRTLHRKPAKRAHILLLAREVGRDRQTVRR